jgi:predicted Zn-dependent peptidase
MKIHTFPNGFRFIYDTPHTNTHLTTILVMVKAGSIYEPSHLKGVSHFIEHMCFKGTKTRTKDDILQYYDSIGAYFNAYTEKEYTCYEIKCNSERLLNTIHIFSDVIMNSLFDKRESKKEYNVVMEENIKSEDDMNNVMFEKVESIVYAGSAYANPIDTLAYHKKPFKYDDAIQFYHDCYQPDNIVCSIVSHIPISTVKRIIQSSCFTEHSKHIPKYIYTSNDIQIRSKKEFQCFVYHKKHISATYLSIYFKVCQYDHPDRYGLTFLSKLIGGGFSSRLFSLLREKNGLTYSSNSDVSFYKPFGHLSIDIILDPNKLIKNGDNMGVLPLCIGLLNDLHENEIQKEEFELIKGYMKGHFSFQLEDARNQCQYNGKHVLLYEDENTFTPYNKIYTKHYASMKKKEVEGIIHKYLTKENMTVCIVGPMVPSVETIRKQCDMYL